MPMVDISVFDTLYELCTKSTNFCVYKHLYVNNIRQIPQVICQLNAFSHSMDKKIK